MSLTSEIKQAGLAGDLTTLRGLQLMCRFSLDEAAQYCGVSPETFRRWRTDREPPVAAVKLLAIRSGACPWPLWRVLYLAPSWPHFWRVFDMKRHKLNVRLPLDLFGPLENVAADYVLSMNAVVVLAVRNIDRGLVWCVYRNCTALQVWPT